MKVGNDRASPCCGADVIYIRVYWWEDLIPHHELCPICDECHKPVKGKEEPSESK